MLWSRWTPGYSADFRPFEIAALGAGVELSIRVSDCASLKIMTRGRVLATNLLGSKAHRLIENSIVSWPAFTPTCHTISHSLPTTGPPLQPVHALGNLNEFPRARRDAAQATAPAVVVASLTAPYVLYGSEHDMRDKAKSSISGWTGRVRGDAR
jgi:hypothetical protein